MYGSYFIKTYILSKNLEHYKIHIVSDKKYCKVKLKKYIKQFKVGPDHLVRLV